MHFSCASTKRFTYRYRGVVYCLRRHFFVTPRVDGWRSQSGDRHCAYFGRLAVCGNCAYHFRNTADVERCERLGNGNSFPHASCNNFCLPDIGNRNIACCKLLGNVGLVFHFAGGNFHRERHFGVVATQTNVVVTHKTKDGKPSFFVAPILPNTQARPLKKQVF